MTALILAITALLITFIVGPLTIAWTTARHDREKAS